MEGERDKAMAEDSRLIRVAVYRAESAEKERDTARAELAEMQKTREDCPRDLPFDFVCPKHGGKLTECPVPKLRWTTTGDAVSMTIYPGSEIPNELWNWDDRKLGDKS